MIHIEPIVVLLRQLPDNGNYGDPYLWKATGIKVDNETLELVGVDRTVTPTIWKEIQEALRIDGWKYVRWDRYRDNGTRDPRLFHVESGRRVK